MISSNFRFQITGSCNGFKNSENLHGIIKYLIESLNILFFGYKIEYGILYLSPYYICSPEFVQLSNSNGKNTDYIFCIAEGYLNSEEFKNLLKNTYNEYSGADGSSKEGWNFYYDNKKGLFVIEPYWVFYHK